MSAVLNIVLPVFGVILAGVLSRKTGLLGADTSEALNKFVFYVALPPLLFLSFARVPIDDIFNWPFINAYLLGTFLTLGFSVVCAWFFFAHRELPILTLHAMLGMFSNTVYLGIPLLILAYGPVGATPAIIVTLISNLIFLTLAAVLIEIGQRKESGSERSGGLSVLTSSLKNPLIIAPLLGTIYTWLGLSLYVPVENFLDLLGRGAGATALFAMGMSLYGFSVSAGAIEIGWITFLKLVVHPLLVWLVVRFIFQLDAFWLETAVILAALPAGSLAFVVAQRYGVYVQRSAAAVVVTTAVSVVTMTIVFLWAAPA